jgi:hypothetical protein
VTQQALAFPLPPFQRIRLLSGQAWQELAAGDWQQARGQLEEALTLIEGASDLRALHALVVGIHAPLVALPGGVEWVEPLCRLTALVQEQRTPLAAAA